MSTLLYLMGECEPNKLDAATHLITWSPIRQRVFESTGIHTYLFSDFAPGSSDGMQFSLQYHDELEKFLESVRTVKGYRWAPIAIQHIKLHLCRYLWLKECIKKHIQEFAPEKIIVSSREDDEVVHALESCSTVVGISVEFLDGPIDQLFPRTYFNGPYGIPKKLFFKPLFCIQVALTRIFLGTSSTLIESVHSLPTSFVRRYRNSFFSTHKFLSIQASALNKIRRLLRVSDAFAQRQEPVCLRNSSLVTESLTHMCTTMSSDEIELIVSFLERHTSMYPEAYINRVLEYCIYFLKWRRVKHLIVASDQLDMDRLLCYAAHQLDISVDCLPHGLIMEDYIGTYRKSDFQPDRMLAWNEASSNALRSQGWDSPVIAHPTYNRISDPYRVPPPNASQWRVLIMYNDIVGTILGNREDSRIRDLEAIRSALIEFGCREENVYIKIRHSKLIEGYSEMQYLTLKQLREVYNLTFQLYKQNVVRREDYQKFDLVIFGYTTGILDAVYAGTPLIIFCPDPDRIGLFRGSDLPHACSKQELLTILSNYPNAKLSESYQKFVNSLSTGESLDRIASYE